MTSKSTKKMMTATFLLGAMLLTGWLGSAALMAQTAQAIEANHYRMYWMQYRCYDVTTCNAQRDFANSALDNLDYIIFHYAPTEVPTPDQINALHGVTTVGDGHKGFEFFSLAQLNTYAPVAKANNFTIISYDLEPQKSPAAEYADPIGSFQQARAIADANGLFLQAVPSKAISENNANATAIAKIANRYHLQSQSLQNSSATCEEMDLWVADRVQLLMTNKPVLQGKITYELSFPRGAAPGKNVTQTIKDCIDRVTPGDVDGLSIWWNGTSWDNGTYQDTVRYYETNHS